VIRIRKDGFRWELAPDGERLIDQVFSPSAAVDIIKESPAKSVARHSLGEAAWYVKRYRHRAGPLRPLKYWFKPSPARQEWRLAQRLESLRLPVVRHVALGECWSWRGLEESVLITEALAGKPLGEVPGTDPAAVLAFVRHLHERGVFQKDLHPDNILVTAAGQLCLVDLYGTKITDRLTARQRDLNLARLASVVPLPLPDDLQELAGRERRRRLRHRSKRSRKHNREFAPRRFGQLTWWVRQPFLNPNVERILADPGGFLASRAEILKPGRSSTVGRADGLVLKRYNLRKLGNLAKDLFRPSRAFRAYRQAYHLELLGLPTARPVAAAEERIFRFLRRSYLLMEEIPGATTLGQRLRAEAGPARETARRVTELIGRLHAEGFSHRDLKESNLVFDREGNLHLLDLDGLRFLGSVSPARRRSDLERLRRDMARYPSMAGISLAAASACPPALPRTSRSAAGDP
jgi:tRNA A-37 threonylcarbamoyl transferase component Bud32